MVNGSLQIRGLLNAGVVLNAYKTPKNEGENNEKVISDIDVRPKYTGYG